ncbi:hypothetical protein BH20VER3_BH20VER3_05010 [soil metagenome]
MIPQGHQGRAGRAHERKDADVINLLMIGGLLLLVLGLSLLVCGGILRVFNRARDARQPPPPRPRAVEAKAFPQPPLLVYPGKEWKKTRSDARLELDSYGWINRPVGIARIPVERAMQLLVERGLPEVGAGQTRLQLMQGRPQTDIQPKEPIMAPAPEASP